MFEKSVSVDKMLISEFVEFIKTKIDELKQDESNQLLLLDKTFENKLSTLKRGLDEEKTKESLKISEQIKEKKLRYETLLQQFTEQKIEVPTNG